MRSRMDRLKKKLEENSPRLKKDSNFKAKVVSKSTSSSDDLGKNASLEMNQQSQELIPFPKNLLKAIRSIPGNNACFDCGAAGPHDWGDVLHGVVVCLQCGPRRRVLGTHIAFVRSFTMDLWDPSQAKAMVLGGNAQLQGFFSRQKVAKKPLRELCSTSQAKYYRRKLSEQVEREMLEGNKYGWALLEDDQDRLLRAAKAANTPEDTANNHNDGAVGTPVVVKVTQTFEVHFGPGTMGLRLTCDEHFRAKVTRVVDGGPADKGGVKVGQYLVGINGRRLTDYEEIMAIITHTPRPIKVLFSKVIKTIRRVEPSSQPPENPLNNAGVKTAGDPPDYTDKSSKEKEKPPKKVHWKKLRQQAMANSQDAPEITVPTSQLSAVRNPRHVALSESESENTTTSEDNTSSDFTTETSNDASEISDRTSLKDTETGASADPGEKLCCSIPSCPTGQVNQSSSRNQDEIEPLDQDEESVESKPTVKTKIAGLIETVMSGSQKFKKETKPSDEEAMEHMIIPKEITEEDVAKELLMEAKQITQEDIEREKKEEALAIELARQKGLSFGSSSSQDGSSEYSTNHEGGSNPELTVESVTVNLQKDSEGRRRSKSACANEEQQREENLPYFYPGQSVQIQCPPSMEDELVASEKGQKIKEKWREAVIVRIHEDGESYRIQYNDFTEEKYVKYSRIKPLRQQNLEVDEPSASPARAQTSRRRQKDLPARKYKRRNKPEDFEEFLEKTETANKPEVNALLKQIDQAMAAPRREIGMVDGCRIYEATFYAGPLGLTISEEDGTSLPIVTRVALGGQAVGCRVRVGDIVLAVQGKAMSSFDQAISAMGAAGRPLTVRFKDQGPDLDYQVKRIVEAPRRKNKSELSKFIPPPLAGGFGKGFAALSSTDPSSSLVDGNGEVAKRIEGSWTSNVKKLGKLQDEEEYEVTFQAGVVGMRIEESVVGGKDGSVVTNVTKGGQAEKSGVLVGSAVCGLFNQHYISHAHCVATLQHGRRPMIVRLRKPPVQS